MQYSMKIAQRVGMKYAFTEEDINNIPNIDIFIDSTQNKIITDGCKEVLYNSLHSAAFKFGEQGLLVSLLPIKPMIHQIFPGNYARIKTNDIYKKLVNNRNYDDLAFIHNHPNNSLFSLDDIRSFYHADALKILVVVGNKHNIHSD